MVDILREDFVGEHRLGVTVFQIYIVKAIFSPITRHIKFLQVQRPFYLQLKSAYKCSISAVVKMT